MTQGKVRIAENSPREGPVLLVQQEPQLDSDSVQWRFERHAAAHCSLQEVFFFWWRVCEGGVVGRLGGLGCMMWNSQRANKALKKKKRVVQLRCQWRLSGQNIHMFMEVGVFHIRRMWKLLVLIVVSCIRILVGKLRLLTQTSPPASVVQKVFIGFSNLSVMS